MGLSCEVCGRGFISHRALGGHLRHMGTDPAHSEFREKWQIWVKSHKLRRFKCMKCGELWEARGAGGRRCVRCQDLYETLPKREYDAIHFERERCASKYKTGKRALIELWVPFDETYQAVVKAIASKETIEDIRLSLSVPYKVVKEILTCHLGADGYAGWRASVKTETAKKNIAVAHQMYDSLSPEDKAKEMSRRFKTCALESRLASQLIEKGWGSNLSMNTWQSIPVGSKLVPREVDIKIDLGGGRKAVVLCDGEAFHGPKTVFGDSRLRMLDDVETAKSFHSLGYSVFRFSESEINSGWAIQHLTSVLPTLKSPVLRMWF
jgi:hypothetical protein